MKPDWQPNEKNIEKLTEKDAKFIFEQAEKLLKDITDTNSLIIARTTTLITIAVGFMLALIGFLFSRYTKCCNLFDNQLLTCLCSIGYVFSLCKILVKNIQAQTYHTVGAEPQKLFTDRFFAKDISEEDRIKYFYLNELIACQIKINMNIATNEMRWDLFNKSLQRLLYTPIVILIFYATIRILKYLFFIITTT